MRSERIDDLRKKIEAMRKDLVELYSESIDQEEILQLSREMDKLIVEFHRLINNK